MNFTNPLDSVYEAFEVANDCFKVVTRIIHIRRGKRTRRTQFFEAGQRATNAALENAAKQAADLAILALFATFERFVIEHLQTANHLLAAGYPRTYSAKLAEKFESEVEYWKFGDVLNLFKGEVNPNLIGQVKQIKQYRDWIAHRNPNKPTPLQSHPEAAYIVLTKMIEQIRQAHQVPMTEEVIDDVASALAE
ncbi:hypothetical protein GCM10027093_45740 [Paraburkholderia jirisanensis]